MTDIKHVTIPCLEAYHVSPEVGFLLEDPLTSLPDYFSPWESLAKDLPYMLEKKEVQHAVHKMELLDHSLLSGYRQKRLALVFLTHITNGFMWQDGDKDPPQVLPRQIAIPLSSLTAEIGGMPGMNYKDVCLANYVKLDPEGPVKLNNVKTIVNMLPEEDYRTFMVSTLTSELQGVPGIKACLVALHAVQNKDNHKLISSLNVILESLKNMRKTLENINHVRTEAFFNQIRVYLTGWGNNSGPLPDGLIFEGVSEKPKQINNTNAGQSSILYVFDATLGIVHQQDHQERLDVILDYMAKAHAEFILALRKCNNVRDYIESEGCDDELVQLYNDCLSALQDFRSYHITLAVKYAIPSGNKEAKEESKHFLPYLKALRDDTNKSKLP